MLVSAPEKVQIFGFVLLFPLTFASNAFAPTAVDAGLAAGLGQGQPGDDPGRRRPRPAQRRPDRHPGDPVSCCGRSGCSVVFAPLAGLGLPPPGLTAGRPPRSRWRRSPRTRTGTPSSKPASPSAARASRGDPVHVGHRAVDATRAPRRPRPAGSAARAGSPARSARSATPTRHSATPGSRATRPRPRSASAWQLAGRRQITRRPPRSGPAGRPGHRPELRRERRPVDRRCAARAIRSRASSRSPSVAGDGGVRRTPPTPSPRSSPTSSADSPGLLQHPARLGAVAGQPQLVGQLHLELRQVLADADLADQRDRLPLPAHAPGEVAARRRPCRRAR